jgi:hypothetical protein
MTNVSNQGLGSRVVINSAANKTSVQTSFGDMVKTGVAATGNTLASVAAPFAPTASAVISAAVNNVQGGGAVSGLTGSAVGASGGGGALGIASTGGSTAIGGIGGIGGGGGSGWTPTGNAALDGQAKLQEMSQTFNMQYLMLQQNMQDENRRFTTVSNVMKTKHETAKGAINNIK